MVNVADRADVAMRFRPVEFRLGHLQSLCWQPCLGTCVGDRPWLPPLHLPRSLERVRRIELPSSAWKAVALPLSYTRMSQGGGKRLLALPLTAAILTFLTFFRSLVGGWGCIQNILSEAYGFNVRPL